MSPRPAPTSPLRGASRRSPPRRAATPPRSSRPSTAGTLKALLIGGVEIDDLPDPAAARAALKAADFVVSLEVRESDVTKVADVVLPIAPVVEKPGMFVNWEGRVRTFDAVIK